MKNVNFTLSVFIILGLLLAGCKNVPPVTSGLGSEQLTEGDKFSDHLQVYNQNLAEQLRITDIKSRKTNALLEINLELTSSYEKSLQLQYQFNWFDKDHFVIESGKSSWRPVELHGRETVTLSGVAPNDNVENFTVYVRKVPEKAYKF